MVFISLAQTQLFLLAMTRVLALMGHIPVLGGQAIPVQVRIALGLLVTMMIIPWQPLSPTSEPMALSAFGIGILKELVIGTLAGYAIDLTFGAVQVAGELISLTGGFTASRILNPALGDASSPIDQLFGMFAILIFLVINGHHIFLVGLQSTFVLLPLNSPIPAQSFDTFALLTGRLLLVGVQMALPVMGALLLTDITLGLLARVAPQIQVFFLGLPLKVGIGILGTSIAISVVYPSLVDAIRKIAPRMLSLIGG